MHNRPLSEQQVAARLPNGDYRLKLTCIICKEARLITVTGQEMYKLQTSDEFIQKILPNHSADERELFISGICGPCFDRAFDEDEE